MCKTPRETRTHSRGVLFMDCCHPHAKRHAGRNRNLFESLRINKTSGRIELPRRFCMEPHLTSSPRWSPTTKLLVGLVVVGIIAFLFIRFTSLITPLLMVFILAYLLHPVTTL